MRVSAGLEDKRSMFRRIVTSVVGLPFLGLFLINGGLALRLALIFVAALGMYEFYRVFIGSYRAWTNVHGLVLAAIFAAMYFAELPDLYGASGMLTSLALLIMVCCILAVVFHESITVPDIVFRGTSGIVNAAITLVSFFYIAYMLGFVSLVREAPGGVYLVWLIFISAWGTDTCAYFTGRTMGRRLLCPHLSPSKTVEGAVGGVVGASALAMLYGLAISHFFQYTVYTEILTFGLFSAAAAVLSIFGDLTASAIKRHAGVKDFGSIFPGHGGVLDRFDSVLFTAPTIYIMMNFI